MLSEFILSVLILFIMPLVATTLIEFGIYAIFVRNNYWALLGFSLLINTVTNPLANSLPFSSYFLIYIEFIVFIVEIFLIKYLLDVKYWKAIVISLLANFLSFLLGFFLLFLVGILMSMT